MKFLDLSLPTPAENLACDEALLEWAEEGLGFDLLRFWEPQTHFVVLGYANRVATEVNRSACQTMKIPILRRCTGGGAVLQGPGCLNYSLILKIDGGQTLRGATAANEFILKRHRTALAMLVGKPVEQQGSTDLSIGGLKFSGNAQRRRKRFLLFHGTVLLRVDLELMERILPLPSRQPQYRQSRAHRDFLTPLAVTAEAVKRALQETWQAFEPLQTCPRERIALLTRDKYATSEWNSKF